MNHWTLHEELKCRTMLCMTDYKNHSLDCIIKNVETFSSSKAVALVLGKLIFTEKNINILSKIKTKWEKPMEKNQSCLRHPVWNDIFIGYQMVGSLCSYKVMLAALRKIRDSYYHSVPFLSTGWLVCGSYRYGIHAQLLTVKTGIGVNSAIEGINSKGLVMSVGVWN